MSGVDLYRTRDFVPDFDAISAQYGELSRELSSRFRLKADVGYGHRDREKIDLIFPAGETQKAPLHVFIHGGYWRHGDKANYRFVAAPALAAGAIVAIVEYDLMPGQRLPLLVDQVRRAVHWLQRNASEFGADPARITVSGHSAGAHLASYLAACGPRDDAQIQLPALKGMILLSGIYDLADIPDSFLKNEAAMTHGEAADWSPLSASHRPSPLRVIAHGGDETSPFHNQAAALDRKLSAEGHATELVAMPGLNHMSGLLNLASADGWLGQRMATMISDS